MRQPCSRRRLSAQAFAFRGKRALSGGSEADLLLWNLATGAEIRSLKGHKRAIWCVAIHPDGRRALSGGNDRALVLWDLETGVQETVLLADLTAHLHRRIAGAP